MEKNYTHRTCTEIDNILFKKIPILNKGFIVVVDYMGDDEAIVNAARVSYGKGTTKKSNTAGLINYLMKHNHTSPFEMCDLKLHLKMPIFVARQWVRHRTVSMNEYSARYSILHDEFYIPEKSQLQKQSTTNNQGRDEKNILSNEDAEEVLNYFQEDSNQCYKHYEDMTEKYNLTRELARTNLPISIYTEFYWKINLHNLLHFVRLRADPHAQYEIRVYAEAILNQIIKIWVPIVYDAFMNHQFNSCKLSAKEIEILKKILHNQEINQENSGVSMRDWNALMQKFDLKNI